MVGWGNWEKWFEANEFEIALRTAREDVQIAENWAAIEPEFDPKRRRGAELNRKAVLKSLARRDRETATDPPAPGDGGVSPGRASTAPAIAGREESPPVLGTVATPSAAGDGAGAEPAQPGPPGGPGGERSPTRIPGPDGGAADRPDGRVAPPAPAGDPWGYHPGAPVVATPTWPGIADPGEAQVLDELRKRGLAFLDVIHEISRLAKDNPEMAPRLREAGPFLGKIGSLLLVWSRGTLEVCGQCAKTGIAPGGEMCRKCEGTGAVLKVPKV